MLLKVIISPRARADYFNIISYLKEEWSIKEIKKFDQKFDKAVTQIASNPLSFEAFRNKDIRRFVLDKHNTIFYKIKKDIVEIIAIWSNKRNPKKLKLK